MPLAVPAQAHRIAIGSSDFMQITSSPPAANSLGILVLELHIYRLLHAARSLMHDFSLHDVRVARAAECVCRPCQRFSSLGRA